MNIFYLEWKNKRPSLCEFRKEIPKEYNFHCSINIRGFKDVFETIEIYGNIDPELQDYEYSENLLYTKRSFLISHLQKSIRKMHSEKAIQVAKHIIDLDITSLLRRLPIIMFEDVIPHTSLPILIWFLIASSKGFVFKEVMIQWLLGVVYFLATKAKHDEYKFLSNTNTNLLNDKDFNENQKLFFKSLYIRISYGGMNCDMEMLNYFIQFWYEKFKLGYHLNDEKIKYIKLNLDPLQRNEWDLCANDFHCYPKLLTDIKKQYNCYEEDYIKKLIWDYSSCYNKRITSHYNEEDYKDWLIIKKYVRYLQKNMNF
jgi:hypothetical protein